MHIKTNNSRFNVALKAELGSLYAKHTATLTRDEAHNTRSRIQSLLSHWDGVQTLRFKNEANAIISGLSKKLQEGGK